MTTQILIEALRAAGHPQAADQLRNCQLANQLREAGRDDLAAALEDGAPAPPASPNQPVQQPEPGAEGRTLRASQDALGEVDH